MSQPTRFYLCLFLLAGQSLAAADEPTVAPVDFARQVRPILERRCVACHGAKKQESGLRLDSGAALLRGGDSGPAVQAQDAAASRLLIAIRGGTDEISRMPPEGPLLEANDVATLTAWVEQGAVLPPDERGAVSGSDHWSLRRPVRLQLPEVRRIDWPQNGIDFFVLARQEAAGLSPAPPAERPTLIRRLNLDLLGLLPSPSDVEDFVTDTRPDAYLRLVERLLASPAYGERWGRHWLDAARYADSNGYTRDFGRQIWKYRDWVIAAINDDRSFDQFTIEQFAGDLLPNSTLDQRIATGFHRNTLFNEEGGTDPEQFRVDAIADRVATTGEVYLGLTLICARCHSHKYDPISQREFYQLFAFLNNCEEPTIEAPSDWQVATGELERREEIRKQIDALDKELEKRRPELDSKQQAWEKTVTPEQRARLPGPVQVAYDMPFEKRDAANKKLIEDYYRISDEARRDFPELDQIVRLHEQEPVIPTTLVMQVRSEPRKTHVHRRGDFLDLGDEVEPSVPAALHPLSGCEGEPTRLDFARWLVDPANPLTSRVIVNRYWQQFFGRGIVETENDFGTQGSLPTHPELLDWLAVEFVESGWSVKHIHRLIVMSAAYQQSSKRSDWRVASGAETAESASADAIDPENRWLARQNRIRLDAEIIRDVALDAAGLLTHKIGGPSVFPPQPEGVFDFTQDPKPWKTATGEDRFRRGMYTQFWRSSPYPALMVFDAPNGNVSCTRRLRSNTPLQALTLANGTQFVECAEGLGERLMADEPENGSSRADLAFRICLSREPTTAEKERLLALVDRQRSAGCKEAAAWNMASRVLLNLDEFITRE